MKRKTTKGQLEIFFGPVRTGRDKAEPHIVAESGATATGTKTSRKLKIQYATTQETFQRFPAIRLQGKWLSRAGFEVNDSVLVEVSEGCLRITKVQSPK